MLRWRSFECTQNFSREAYWKATARKTEKDSEITIKLNIAGKDCEELEGVAGYLFRWWAEDLCIRGVRKFFFFILRVTSYKETQVIIMSFRKREHW